LSDVDLKAAQLEAAGRQPAHKTTLEAGFRQVLVEGPQRGCQRPRGHAVAMLTGRGAAAGARFPETYVCRGSCQLTLARSIDNRRCLEATPPRAEKPPSLPPAAITR